MTEAIKEIVKKHYIPIRIKTIKTEKHLRSEIRIYLNGKEFAAYKTTNPEDIRNAIKFIREYVQQAREKQEELFKERFKNDYQIRKAYFLYKLKLTLS